MMAEHFNHLWNARGENYEMLQNIITSGVIEKEQWPQKFSRGKKPTKRVAGNEALNLVPNSPLPVQMQHPAALLAAPHSAFQPPLPPAPAPKKTAQERLNDLDAIKDRIPVDIYKEQVATIVRESI